MAGEDADGVAARDLDLALEREHFGGLDVEGEPDVERLPRASIRASGEHQHGDGWPAPPAGKNRFR